MFKKIIITFVILGLILTPFSFSIPQRKNVQGAGTCSTEEIVVDTTWILNQSPYVFDPSICDVYVNPGVTLTIEPGVVVKLEKQGIIVYGELKAQGTEDNPIISVNYETI